jgi:hypothetical protein
MRCVTLFGELGRNRNCWLIGMARAWKRLLKSWMELWLNEMKFSGGSHCKRVEYTEDHAPEKLAWLHSVSDGEWEVASNPIMPGWPRVQLTTVTFTQIGDGTDVRLIWVPHESSEAKTACFAGASSGLD